MKVFDTYPEAYNYWMKNKDSVPSGYILGISTSGLEVRQSPISEPEKKRSRAGEVNTRWHSSDDLGTQGVLNHADGKKYDSKSAYEKAVKAKGCRIVGNDFNDVTYKTPLERGIKGDFNVRPALKESIQRYLG